MTSVKHYQHTIGSAVSAVGAGLFTGKPVTITFKPAPCSRGIVFRRVDLPGAPEVPALIDAAIATPRHTTLQHGTARIETTEHVLAAFAGMGIDNAIVELDAQETPMFDGSAEPFATMIEEAGIERQGDARRMYQVTHEITVREGNASIRLLPHDDHALELSYAFDGGTDCPIAPHRFQSMITPDLFARDIAPARTFSTLNEAHAAQAEGLFGHLKPKDMLVIGPSGPIENALRFADEPARHKLLDLLGDLALVGVRIIGQVHSERAGHAMNRALAREIAQRVNSNT